MGLRSHHCFVADPDFGTKVMACRIPCLCTSCKARFDLPTKEDRYKNPRKDCDFWEIYKILRAMGGMIGCKSHFKFQMNVTRTNLLTHSWRLLDALQNK